jgi:hypothetical protein
LKTGSKNIESSLQTRKTTGAMLSGENRPKNTSYKNSELDESRSNGQTDDKSVNANVFGWIGLKPDGKRAKTDRERSIRDQKLGFL